MVGTSWMTKNMSTRRSMQDPMVNRRVDHGWDDHRLSPDDQTVFRSPPVPIEKALRDYCHIDLDRYFLATMREDGGVEYFASSERLSNTDISKIFNVEEFQYSHRRRASDDHTTNSGFSVLSTPLAYANSPRTASGPATFHNGGPVVSEAPRRRRTGGNRRREQEVTPPVVTKMAIRIGNEKGVSDFYTQRFKNIQQTACKLIGKLWIKTVAPKKQSTHPYTGSVIPDWWPKPWGSGSTMEMVRHKEPDHLKKFERVPLLVHLLRMIIEPNENRHPDIQKLNLTVSKLEDVTRDGLSVFFSDSKNEAKRPYLKEIFKVARMEERYKRGEINESAYAYVMPADQLPGEDDESDDEEEGHQKALHPESNLSIMLHSQNPATAMPGQSSMMTLPAPNPHYGSAPMAMKMEPEHSPYIEHSTTAMQIDSDMQDQHGPSRRASMYNSSSPEYASSCGPQMPLYPTTTGPSWTQATTASASASMFPFPQSHHSPLPPPQPQAHSNGYPTPSHMDVQMSQHPFMAPPTFEPLPNAANLFRNLNLNDSGSPGHGHNHGSGYGHRGYGN